MRKEKQNNINGIFTQNQFLIKSIFFLYATQKQIIYK